jgi:hypothetical protein
MKPTTPPPAPYCQSLPWDSVVIGAAPARENSESCRSTLRAVWNMSTDVDVIARYCRSGSRRNEEGEEVEVECSGCVDKLHLQIT